MRMQIFGVKNRLCEILKTKNCVPFEVQNTSSIRLWAKAINNIHTQYFFKKSKESGQKTGTVLNGLSQ